MRERCLVKRSCWCSNDMFSACYSGQNTKKRIGDVKDRHGLGIRGRKGRWMWVLVIDIQTVRRRLEPSGRNMNPMPSLSAGQLKLKSFSIAPSSPSSSESSPHPLTRPGRHSDGDDLACRNEPGRSYIQCGPIGNRTHQRRWRVRPITRRRNNHGRVGLRQWRRICCKLVLQYARRTDH